MSVAGRLRKERGEKANPRQVAERIIARLDAADLLAGPPTVAGPGFVNFRLSPQYVAARCTAALADDRLGIPAVAEPQTVVVEYSSPNIAKQMHVGHIRSTILGDCASRVLEFLGHAVIRQNHVGDWGTQFGMLIEQLERRSGDSTFEISDLESFYRQSKRNFDDDEDFRTKSRENVVRLQGGDPAAVAWWQKLVERTREHYLPIYGRLDVGLGIGDERGESFYNERLPGIADELEAAGVAEVSDGALVSFAGGHKSPLMVRKSDGGFGYGTTDLAAAEYRAKTLQADRVIYFVDARQGQHFQQVFRPLNPPRRRFMRGGRSPMSVSSTRASAACSARAGRR